MPYSAEHKDRTRQEIVEKARVLFNRYGVEGVSIDHIMAEAGLTRGGFYNHFKNKEELFAEAVSQFLMGQGAKNREDAGVHTAIPGQPTVQAMVDGYLSSQHLGDLDNQCPMIAMPSDVARAGEQVRLSYQALFEAMTGLFEGNLSGASNSRQLALTLGALCVGGMVLARTLPDNDLAEEVKTAARQSALGLLEARG